MKNILIATALTLTTANTMAHEDNHITISSDNCAVEFQNDVQISPDLINITTANQQVASISNAGVLIVDGKDIALSESQRALLAKYSDNVRGQLPRVADIAFEGIEIASTALNEVATTFNIDSLQGLDSLIDELKGDVQTTFYQNGSFVMGKQTFDEFGEHFESEFEEKIEQAVESSMMQSIGSILMAIGSEIKDANGDMSQFEQRMESFAQRIEQSVESRAKHIEQQAEGLCNDFAQIAYLEQDIVKSIPELNSYQLFIFK